MKITRKDFKRIKEKKFKLITSWCKLQNANGDWGF